MARQYFNLVSPRTGEPYASFCIDSGVEFAYDPEADTWEELKGGEIGYMFQSGESDLQQASFADTIAKTEAPTLTSA